MKSFYLTLVLILTAGTFAGAQSWQSIGGCGTNDQTEAVYAVISFQGKLIAAGTFATAGGISANNIAQYDGTTWTSLGSGIGPTGNSVVRTMAIYHNELYVGGTFSTAGGIPVSNIAKWNGTSWDSVGMGVRWSSGGASLNALTEYNGKLYASGFFNLLGTDTVNNIARWDGSSWSALPGVLTRDQYGRAYHGISGSTVHTLCPFQGRLYIGGEFPDNCINYLSFCITAPDIAVWNDTVLSIPTDTGTFPPLGGLEHDNSYVRSLTTLNGELYASGLFDTAGYNTVQNIAKYDGTTWHPVPSPYYLFSGLHMPMYTYNGSVIGAVLSGSTIGVAKLNDSSWSQMGGALTGSNPSYSALCEWNGDLYVGGSFSQIGSSSIQNIAKWSNATGIETLEGDTKAFLYPNPANESITIQNAPPNSPIIISDVIGQTLLTDIADEHGAKRISISALPKGLYFINNLKFVKD